MPTLNERLTNMARARDDVAAALRLTKAKMKQAYEHDKRTAHQFNVGDMVWLQSKDIKIHQATPKLGPRQLGPTEKIVELDYYLDLPSWLKIHPVFHVNRLSPWHDNDATIPPPPEPVLVDGPKSYEVDKVLDSRVFRCCLENLIKWKGYSNADNLWEPVKNVTGSADEAIADFHRANPSASQSVKATRFLELSAFLRPCEFFTDPASYSSDAFAMSWEDSKYLGNDSSRGHSVLEGG